jgi:predicted transcriptional regulator
MKMSDELRQSVDQPAIMKMTADIVSAYVGRNALSTDQVPAVIDTVHTALQSISAGGAEAAAEPPTPAVSIRSSVKPDYIVCLEDGKKLKMLKRHLRAWSRPTTPNSGRRSPRR